MEREQNNDLVQENSNKHDAMYRVSSDNFNLTGLNKNQPVPYTGGLEKMSSNMISNNIYPDKSYHLLFKSMFDDPSNNPLVNLFKSSIENFQYSNNLSQVPSSQQDLLGCFGNNVNSVSLLVNPQYLGSSFPSVSSFPQVKANKQSPLQGLSFEIKDVSSINSNNNHNNSSSSNNNSALLSMNQNNINNSLLNSNDNSNNSNKSIQNGLSRGISSSNSNFNCNLQGFNKPLMSNEYPISSFVNNGFNPNQSILSNEMAQSKEPFTKISSSSSSSRTHSTKRGTTIIIQAQNNNSSAIVNKQSSDSNQQENILNQNEMFGMQNLNNDQVKQSNMYEFLSKQIDQKVLPQKESSANSKANIEKILFNQNKLEEIKKEEQEEEQNNMSTQKVKKSARISKKQNLSGEEKIPNKKRKDDHTLKQSGDHNFSDETQGLNCDENVKPPAKLQIKQEEEKIEKNKTKNVQIKEEDFHEQAVSEALSSEVKPLKNKEKLLNSEGQEKKSSSRQSQHKNVYKNFGKELLRFVRCKQQACKELTQDEYGYLLDQLTGGLNDKDTKQTLPIQKKEKLQLLWTLKTESNAVSQTSQSTNSSKKQKNDHHNKNEEDKTQEYYFITEKEDEIVESDNIELKTKKYFRKISWEFFNEWAYQYVINSRKLDKKEIHLKCIPSFLYGIMCPKSLEVFKPIREHDKIPQINQAKSSNVNLN
ncbi:hypothetical protein ABPG72_018609 [Tetrahymena utriculariae]